MIPRRGKVASVDNCEEILATLGAKKKRGPLMLRFQLLGLNVCFDSRLRGSTFDPSSWGVESL